MYTHAWIMTKTAPDNPLKKQGTPKILRDLQGKKRKSDA